MNIQSLDVNRAGVDSILKRETHLLARLAEWVWACAWCLPVGDSRTRTALLAAVSTTLYGISRNCDSLMPSVSTSRNSRCCFSSSGSRDLPSDGERDLDLQHNKF